MTDPEGLFEKFTELSDANVDIQKSLSLDFVNKWSGQSMNTPVVFIDWAQLWATMKTEHPELLGDWTTPLVASQGIKEILGELAEPLADFIRLSRHSAILQHVNLYTKLKYLELVFDLDGTEKYMLTEKANNASLSVQEKLLELVEAYGHF